MRTLLTAIAAFVLAACGQAAAPNEADAQTSAAVQTGDVTADERTAILAALPIRANAQGQVENECGERVTPEFRPLDLGPESAGPWLSSLAAVQTLRHVTATVRSSWSIATLTAHGVRFTCSAAA